MSEFVKEIDGATLKQLIASKKPIVCDFWAAWCMPCRMLAPTVEAVAEELGTKAEFVKVNVDENPEEAIQFGISAIPDIVVFAGGEVKAHNRGFVPKDVLRDFVEKNLE